MTVKRSQKEGMPQHGLMLLDIREGACVAVPTVGEVSLHPAISHGMCLIFLSQAGAVGVWYIKSLSQRSCI